MCDDRCGIEVHLRDGRVVDIRGDREHTYNGGRVCIKARAAVEMVHHPDRLRTPLKRVGRRWIEVGLEDALDEIAERATAIQRRYGPRSLGVWKGEAVGFAQQEGLARRFAHAVGTPNYLSNNSMCSIARYLGYRFTMGSHPVPDYRRSACIVVWGANPPASQPNVAHAIAGARRRGAALVVVDPRSSTISRGATIHARVRPGTDGALAWALVHELIAAGAYDKASVVRRSMGFEEAAEYARSFTPRRAEEETGVPAEVVREIAALLADSAPRVAQCTGNGLDHHRNGVDAVRAIALLDGLLGTIGEPGGSRPAGLPPLRSLALHDARPLDHLSPLGADRFPVLYSERHECHTMTAVDAMLEGRPYPLRALLVTAANPALTNPYSDRVRRALGALDLLVVRDLFMTETAAAAHYVLPAASFLERSELHFHVETQTLTLTEAVLRLPEVQTEYEFWRGLARRMGAGSLFPWEDERALNAWLLEPTGLALDDLERDRTGVPCRVVPAGDGSAPLDTPSGKFEFVSRRLGEMGYAALPAYRRPEYLERPDHRRPFVAVTGARQLAFAGSRYRNLGSLRRPGDGPRLELHPDDAAALDVGDSDVVRVTSRVGSVEVPARVVRAGAIVPGVVQLTHGWSEANANEMTPDDEFDPISGFPQVKEVQVAVERVPSGDASETRGPDRATDNVSTPLRSAHARE